LHIRWLRESEGHVFGDKPRGGTTHRELFSALERAGYRATRLWDTQRRMRLGDFLKAEGRSGRWLLDQYEHVFALTRDNRRYYTKSRAVVTQAYRITRLTEPAPVLVPPAPASKPKPAKALVQRQRYERVLQAEKRWQAKLRRAQSALKRLAKRRRYYERELSKAQPQEAANA
jgi:hypothetical protein